MATNKGLGRGLDKLLPTNFDANTLLNQGERIQNLFITDVRPNPDQPRRFFDEQALEELASSIKQHGVLQPIIVSPKDSGYEIIAGERRWRASQKAGQKTIPAVVREKAELERLEIALIENVQRVDLSPLEQARSIEYLHEQFNMAYNEIAAKLGKAAPTVNNIVRLLRLPNAARTALETGKITEGHARAILALKGQPARQQELLNLIINQNWSVRQAEQFVTANKQGIKSSKAVSKRTVKETTETKKLSESLGKKVTIHHTAKGGKLEIHFRNDQELEDLYKNLIR